MTSYPKEIRHRPVAASIAVVIKANQVLLVQRSNPPDAGRWGFPGGKIEFGETIEQAAIRELLEETAIIAEAKQTFTALDAFDEDEATQLRQHFILVAVLCEWMSGSPVAGDDALEARWFDLGNLSQADLALSLEVERIATQAADLMSSSR